eukprot:12448918-Ditylum_brightwellii.AAC.1
MLLPILYPTDNEEALSDTGDEKRKMREEIWQEIKLLMSNQEENDKKHLLSQHGNTCIAGRDANSSGKASFLPSSSTAGTTHEYGDVSSVTGNEQLLRRRSLYILRHLVELQAAAIKTKSFRTLPQEEQQDLSKRVATWKKYILCFEALEMEEEAHL